MAVGTRRDVLRASVLALVVSVTVAVAVLALAFALARSNEAWDLWFIVLGSGAAGVLGVVVLGAIALDAFGRVLSRGQRWRPAVAAAIGGLAAAIVWVAGLLQGGIGVRLSVLCALCLPVLLPLVVTGHARRMWAAIVVVAAVALGVLEFAPPRPQRPYDPRADLAQLAGALPLTDGGSLDSPLPGGGEYLSTTWPSPDDDLPLGMQWRRGAHTPDEDNYSIEAGTQRTDCAAPETEPRCTVIGRGPHGDITRYTGGTEYVFVRVGDVEWRMDTFSIDEADAIVVLDSLEPVDVDTFLRAAEGASGNL